MTKNKISVIGLGYVGLPIAIELSKYYKVIGFDVSKKRVSELNSGIDKNNEFDVKKLRKKGILYTSKDHHLEKCNTFIVTVPTPVNNKNQPDVMIIKSAASLVGKYIKKGGLVIFESTVYPGFTKEILVPLIEKQTNFKLNKDFYVGYSPERINPGDKKRSIRNINKIVSGSNTHSLNLVYNIYKKIVKAKVIKTKSIEIAESAKVIENCQRDLNIAFMNELLKIFTKMNINFYEVLKAAKTKWNFLNFVPGLVGGHCIGVDPYYLAYKSHKVGYKPKIILSGRKINNSMPRFYADLIGEEIKKNNNKLKSLILGATFKENCKDLRNSKVLDLYNNLNRKGIKTHIYDPMFKYNEKLFVKNNVSNSQPKARNYDLIILAVPHKKFKTIGIKRIMRWGKKDCKFFDIKNYLIKNV